MSELTMAMALSSEIYRQEIMRGVAYALPRRPLGGLRWAALAFVIFGAVFAGGPLTMAIAQVRGSAGLFGIVLLVFSLLFVAAGAAVSLLGLAMLRGQSTIELQPDAIIATERLGPLRWRRRRHLTGLRRLEIKRGATRVNGRLVTEGTLAEMSAVIARYDNGRPVCAGAARACSPSVSSGTGS